MIFVLALVFLLSQFLLGLHIYLKVRHLYKYPNVFGTPIIGNLYYFYMHLTIRSLDSLTKYYEKVSKKHGYDLFLSYTHGTVLVVMSCPNVVKEISFNPSVGFKPEQFRVMSGLADGILLHTESDQEWKRRRKEANHSLRKNNVEGPFHEIFVRYANKIVEDIENEPHQPDIHYYINRNTIHTLKETLYGMDNFIYADRKAVEQFLITANLVAHALGNRIIGFIVKITPMFIVKAIYSGMAKHLDEETAAISEKIKKIPKEDDGNMKEPLGFLIAKRNAMFNRPYREFEKEINELTFVAWHSSSVTLCGMVTYLAMYQDVQENVWLEQCQIFDGVDREPTVDDLKEMVYMDRFIKESLRFLSPTVLAKQVTNDIKLEGFELPAGANLIILIHKLRKDPRYWKDPQVFNPDRFIDEIADVPTYAYSTFGVGVRSCPGSYYATNAMKIILSTISRKYKISTDMKFEDLEYEMDLMNRITNQPLLRIEKRT